MDKYAIVYDKENSLHFDLMQFKHLGIELTSDELRNYSSTRKSQTMIRYFWILRGEGSCVSRPYDENERIYL